MQAVLPGMIRTHHQRRHTVPAMKRMMTTRRLPLNVQLPPHPQPHQVPSLVPPPGSALVGKRLWRSLPALARRSWRAHWAAPSVGEEFEHPSEGVGTVQGAWSLRMIAFSRERVEDHVKWAAASRAELVAQVRSWPPVL